MPPYRRARAAKRAANRKKAVEYGLTVDPGHGRSGPTLQTTRAVIVDLAAPKRAKDLRLGVREHVAETV